MLAPAMIFYLLFNYLPMFGMLLAFKNYNYSDGFFKSPWIKPLFLNFRYLFVSKDTWIIIRNTVGYNLLFIVLGLVTAVSLAIILNELRNRIGAKLYQSFLFLPHFISWVVVSYYVVALLDTKSGVANQMLVYFGLEKVRFYMDPRPWPFFLAAINLWKGVGYGVIIYLASLTAIDPLLYEAAVIDGAGKLKQIRHITLPSLIPTMIILTLLGIGRIFYGNFGLFYTVTLQKCFSTLKSTTAIIDTYVFNVFMYIGDVGMSTAAGLFQSVVGLVMIVSCNKLVKMYERDYALF